MDLFMLLPISSVNALQLSQRVIERNRMKKKLAAGGLGLALLVFCSPASIAGLRSPGPCYGYGCPALSSNNKPYDAKANKDEKSDDTATAKSDAKPAAGQQITPPANTKQ
jgi:hypothetical protein